MKSRRVTNYTEHTERVEFRGRKINYYSLNAYRDGATFFRPFRHLGPPEQLLKGKRILDVGSGFGGRPAYYAELSGAEVVGVDIYQQAVRDAEEFAEAMGLSSRLKFLVSGGEVMPFEPNSFDLVTSYDALEHVSNPDVVLREVARVLRPGGMFLSVAPSYLQPYGVHFSQFTSFPYLSALFSETTLIRAVRRWADEDPQVRRWTDVKIGQTPDGREVLTHVNKYLVSDFRRAVKSSGLETVTFDVRCFLSNANLLVAPVLSLPLLRDLLGRSIVLVLRKPA
jgi:ubiquinone/menaquinone biosynthesis C-methylase UbiE